MSINSTGDANPYQAPAVTGAYLAPGTYTPQGAIERKFIKKFRQEIHAVGGFWIILGALAVGLAVFALAATDGPRWLFSPDDFVLLSVVGGLGIVWIVLGTLACTKQMWAVKTALVLSYVSLAGQVLILSILAAILLILVIIQAHRVIGWAKQIEAAGLPLTIRPEQIAADSGFATSVQPPGRR